eukprot:scaffold41013_cov60-Phaeocystis_antarctica.AAC.4
MPSTKRPHQQQHELESEPDPVGLRLHLPPPYRMLAPVASVAATAVPTAALNEEALQQAQTVAAARAAAAAPLTAEEARQQARAEGLTLRLSKNKTGYFGVSRLAKPGLVKPYQGQAKHGGKLVYLGSFATAEEAALCVARSPEGQTAAERPAAAVPLTSEEARQQAQAEGLKLRVAETKTGYHG